MRGDSTSQSKQRDSFENKRRKMLERWPRACWLSDRVTRVTSTGTDTVELVEQTCHSGITLREREQACCMLIDVAADLG